MKHKERQIKFYLGAVRFASDKDKMHKRALREIFKDRTYVMPHLYIHNTTKPPRFLSKFDLIKCLFGSHKKLYRFGNACVCERCGVTYYV